MRPTEYTDWLIQSKSWLKEIIERIKQENPDKFSPISCKRGGFHGVKGCSFLYEATLVVTRNLGLCLRRLVHGDNLARAIIDTTFIIPFCFFFFLFLFIFFFLCALVILFIITLGWIVL